MLTFTLSLFSSWVQRPTCRWVIRFWQVALAWSTITARRIILHPGRLIRRWVPDLLQVAKRSLGGSGCSLLHSLLTWSHVIWSRAVRRNAAVCIKEDLESADVEVFTSRTHIYKRGNLSLFCLLHRRMRPEYVRMHDYSPSTSIFMPTTQHLFVPLLYRS